MDTSMLLAIDTSSGIASLALKRDSVLLADESWDVGRRHSQELIGHLDALLAQAGGTVADLAAIGVALGPGSFNGVRVGVTAAKTLAFALGLPLYGVCTLDVIAAGAAYQDDVIVCALLEAGRGEVYRALYRFGVGGGVQVRQGLVRVTEYAIVGLPALAAELAGLTQGVVCAGECQAATRGALAAELGSRARFVEPVESRGALLADIVTERQQRGERDEPATMEPIYLRRPNITQPAARHTGALAAERSASERSLKHGGDARALRH
jgi:tRNA threonylcarbamoyladenosine biosynthesis protein TsaB